MAKKTRLKLENLRVESFVTSMEKVKGGQMLPISYNCPLLLTAAGCSTFCIGTETGGFDPGCQCPAGSQNTL